MDTEKKEGIACTVGVVHGFCTQTLDEHEGDHTFSLGGRVKSNSFFFHQGGMNEQFFITENLEKLFIKTFVSKKYSRLLFEENLSIFRLTDGNEVQTHHFR